MFGRFIAVTAFAAVIAAPAAALDMPTRKAGLWEIKMVFVGRKLPAQVMKQCIDAATDKLMNSSFGGSAQQSCAKQDVTRSGSSMIIDSVCKFGDATTTSHAVVTGSFDSAYTVDVTSTQAGGRATPGLPDGSMHMNVAAKWLGPCGAGQQAGDIIMANGMKINVLNMPHMGGNPRR